MGDAGKLLESGRLAIVPGVGYPNPNRSHFRSMTIWQSARLDERDHTGLGWIGRGLDGGPTTRDGAPAAMLIGPDVAAAGHPRPAIRQRRARPPRRLRPERQGGRGHEPDRLLDRRGRPGPVPAPQPAGRLYHGGPPGGRRREPRRPRVLSRVRAGPPARADGAADQGRAGHARLLPRAGRLRHPRPPARRSTPRCSRSSPRRSRRSSTTWRRRDWPTASS